MKMMRRQLAVHARRAAVWRRLSSVSAASEAPAAKKKSRSRSEPNLVEIGRVLTALREFHARHGHAVVPPRFVIPASSDDGASGHSSEKRTWPLQLHGLKLGDVLKRLYHLSGSQELHEELRSVGLHPDEDGYKAFYWRATTLAALEAYKKQYEDLYVPRSFVVPSGDDAEHWPIATWGLRLGQQVHTLRKKANDDEDSIPEYQVDALQSIDFVWDVMEHRWATTFLPALQKFHELHGHGNVPQKFSVPSSAEDPSFEEWSDLVQCHGYRLGAMVNRVRRGDTFTMQVVRYFDVLEDLGFTFSSFDQNWSERVLPALEVFYNIHGHSDIGARFEVPQGDMRWPRATWGMRLGFIVQNIRSRGDFFPQIMRDGERLDTIGFVWNRAEVKWRQMVLPALETFVALHDHTNIPRSFVVPRESPWPRDAYDLRLGRIVAMPSARSRFASFIEIDRKRLEQIGFDWSSVDETKASDSDTDSDTDDE